MEERQTPEEPMPREGRKDETTKRGRLKNGSEVPREIGINERAINRVNGLKHAILPQRHFQGDGLLTG